MVGQDSGGLARLGNLTVIDLDAAAVDALAAHFKKGMRFDAILQDGELQMLGEGAAVVVHPRVRMGSVAQAA